MIDPRASSIDKPRGEKHRPDSRLVRHGDSNSSSSGNGGGGSSSAHNGGSSSSSRSGGGGGGGGGGGEKKNGGGAGGIGEKKHHGGFPDLSAGAKNFGDMLKDGLKSLAAGTAEAARRGSATLNTSPQKSAR
jgi:hypothetical protein